MPVRRLRMVDKVTNGSVPGVSDINIELNDYSKRLLKNFVSDFEVAQSRQDRVQARQLGIQEVWDDVSDMRQIMAHVVLLNSLGKQTASTGICACATVGDDMKGLRKLVLPWMMYHTEIGVQKFFIYYYGKDEGVVSVLKQVQHLELIFAEGHHANYLERQLFDLWQEKHVKQFDEFDGDKARLIRNSLTMEVALNNAREQGKCRWMLNLDVDELIRPGHPNFSLDKTLTGLPEDIAIITFMNFEGQPEAGDIRNRFEQITLFRAHAIFVAPEAYNHRSKFRLGQNRAHLSFYADGRSAVRLDFPGYVPFGIYPHHYGLRPHSKNHASTTRPKQIVSNETVILHYAYTQVDDVMYPSDSIRAECNSKQGDQCYYSAFDVDAQNVGSQEAALKFFYSRMVLSEGSPVRCKLDSGEEGWCPVHDVEYLKQLATRSGLMHRFFEPQMIVRGHQRLVKIIMDAIGPRLDKQRQQDDNNLDLQIDIVGPKTSGDTYKDFIDLVSKENTKFKQFQQQHNQDQWSYVDFELPEFQLLWGTQELSTSKGK
eukprot:TRINITY_DN14920_c0_g1_i10.p1 TRINITY_DN14920_c0_g1~~TRINITY_DN14920_c0_g1_i10.p1  ORF type:complete len:542 (-),score=55.17 TRINITY_DN14920_c0_g1_i10:436-2061(-)